MKLLISQSNYIPWRGFFDLIRSADVYIIYDSMQFTKNDWRNRNLIRNQIGKQWLTVPCGSSISRSIYNVNPTNPNWNSKHASTLKHTYSKSPYWDDFGKDILNVYQDLKGLSLSQVNQALIRFILDIENISTHVIRDVDVMNQDELMSLDRSERLLQLSKLVKASTYLSAPAAKDYLKTSIFQDSGVEVEFFNYPKYPIYHPLECELSCIDTLLYRGSLFK